MEIQIRRLITIFTVTLVYFFIPITNILNKHSRCPNLVDRPNLPAFTLNERLKRTWTSTLSRQNCICSYTLYIWDVFRCPCGILGPLAPLDCCTCTLTLCILETPKRILSQTGKTPAELSYNVAFYQGLHCLLRLK